MNKLKSKRGKKRVFAGFREVETSVNSNLSDRRARMVIFAINLVENPL